MGDVTFGDIFFILLVGGGIYLILALVNRANKGRPGAADSESGNPQK